MDYDLTSSAHERWFFNYIIIWQVHIISITFSCKKRSLWNEFDRRSVNNRKLSVQFDLYQFKLLSFVHSLGTPIEEKLITTKKKYWSLNERNDTKENKEKYKWIIKPKEDVLFIRIFLQRDQANILLIFSSLICW